MRVNLPLERKSELLKRAKSGESISRICREAGISRTILYRWLNSSKVSTKIKHSKSFKPQIVNKILKVAIENPNLSVHEIAKLSNVSSHGAWKVLKKNNLNTVKKRVGCREEKGTSLIRVVESDIKLKIIKRYETGESISVLCEKFGISRTVFYRWLKRYRTQGKTTDALINQRPEGNRHWRSKPEAKELLLQIIIDQPELSVHKLAKVLTDSTGKKLLGAHGIHNLLVKMNLNHMESRIAYANSYTPTVFIPPVPASLVLPQTPRYTFISHLPPPLRDFVSSYGPLVVSSFLISLFGIIYISTLSSSGSITGALGVTFAWLAIILGMFFFIYSVKYYITIAIVLSFSRNQLNSDSEQQTSNSLKSFWGRLFGVEITVEDPSNKKSYIEKAQLGLQHDLSNIKLDRLPFISIQLSTYNEKRVINRLLTAATSMDYPNYEVIIADDSNDETVTLIEEFVSEWNKSHTSVNKNHPLIKISRRESRDGYKGGALREALKITDPRAEFILIFDADFIPYPDSITQFLKYFKYTAGTLDFSSSVIPNSIRDPQQDQEKMLNQVQHDNKSNIAAVQGYQWHVLNKSENWITRGVRSEYAGSYVIERSGAEVYGGLKQISGSVYMIRRDVLQSIGWGTSITEDFELTLRLYEKGWKVVYTPYIQAPAEAVSTLKRLIRQRMRWAEGHSFNIKRMFWRLMRGHWAEDKQSVHQQVASSKYKVSGIKYETQTASIPNTKYLIPNTGEKATWIPSPLTLMEKLELLYLTPYYLQAAFFILGTISWLISETVFRVRLPFWTEVWGWSLVLTNLFALPLMNLVGLFMEESEEKDYAGLLSFIVLSYIVAPFQAYAAIKGFLEDREGPWFRTPKTGRITDIFVPGRFVRIFSGLFGRPQIGIESSVTEAIYKGQGIAASLILPQADNKYLALLNYPSVRTLNPFNLSRYKRRRIANIFLVALSSISVIVSSLTPYVAVREVAYASSFTAAKTKNNSNNRQDESKDKKFQGLEGMRQPILKRAKTDKGMFDYVFHTEPRVKASFDKYELDLELTGINGNMLSRETKAKRDDSLFIYEDIRAGIDARMKYLGNGFASELKLKKNLSLRNIEFSIRTNLNARIRDNEVLFFDSKKENIEVFRIGKPYMYEESNPQNESKNIRYSLSKSFDGWKLKKTLSPDASKWLNDPERSYPVILDPTVNSVVQTSIDDTTDSRWESPARKVAYMPNATGGAAWYATHTDGGAVHLEKCLVSAGCESTTDWTSVSTQLDTTETDADNRNSTVWKHNDLLYIAWFDNSGDKYQFTSINTASSDAQGSICIGSDQGSAIDVYNTIAVASDGDYAYVALVERGTGDGANDLEGIFRVATSGCSETDIITGSNIDQNDAVEVITKGDDPYYLFNDSTGMRMSIYVDDGSPGWDSANHDVNGGTADNDNTDLSAVTDGTDIWVFQRDGTTGDSELYKCSSCSASSPSFSALTDPWSAGNFTSSGDVGLSYLSSANEIMAVMVDDQTGAANFHIRSKKSNADTISWQSEFEFDISSQNIAMNYLTMTAIAPTSDQVAVVFQDATNSEFEFSTVPENIYLLIAFLPIFIYGKYLSGKKALSKANRPKVK